MEFLQSNINVVKRDGRTELYCKEKLLKVVIWACKGDRELALQLIDAVDIKLNDGIHISKLYDELITTAANLMSPIQRIWDTVAKNLFLMKLYKESYNLKNTGYYPDYKQVLDQAISEGLYDAEIINSFDSDELQQLAQIMVPDRDMLFTYKGLYLMNNKYCIRSRKGEPLELPQHAYLRLAIYSFWKESKDVRIDLIKKEYDIWSKHIATAGTPRILNSGTPRAQLASCVLSTVADDTDSIMDTAGNLATYSKFSGGLALDISHIRSSGSKIRGNRGVSNGPVPFIKIIEAVVSGFNQGGTRSGSCVVTYPFWHHDVMNLLPLNDAGGSEDNRARKLKYTMRLHNILKERCKTGQDITLFNPVDVPLLNCTYGEAFEKAYVQYEKDNSIRKKTIPARDLMFSYMKYRSETGNTYAFFSDNVNEQNIVGDYIGASNLCTEITVTSTPSKNHKNELIWKEDGTAVINETKDSGEIGLCNLFSINLYEWDKLTIEEKESVIDTLLRGADNIIDYQFYPIKEAKLSNIRKRPIGIGVSNFANLLASKKIRYTDKEAREFTHQIFEELYYLIYSKSSDLAVERGPFSYFKNTNWSKGETPLSLSILQKKGDDHELNYPLQYDWDALGQKIKTHGVRFSLHGAIAPTATSGRIISATESIEPITEFFVFDEGTQSLPSLAPNMENRAYYELAYEIPCSVIIELAAIRQKFIDQAQSVNSYYKKLGSTKDLINDLFLAMDLGVKTLYYLRTPKANYTSECESCT